MTQRRGTPPGDRGRQAPPRSGAPRSATGRPAAGAGRPTRQPRPSGSAPSGRTSAAARPAGGRGASGGSATGRPATSKGSAGRARTTRDPRGATQDRPPRQASRPAGPGTASSAPSRPAKARPAKARPAKARKGGSGGGKPPRSKPLSLGVGHPRRRARFLMIAICCVFSLFAVQLLRIQGVESSAVSAAALGSRTQKVTIPAQRGDIVDTDGVVLADSVDRRNVTGDPLAMAEYHKTVNGKRTQVGLSGAAADLAPLLGVKAADLLDVLNKAAAKDSRFTYLAKDIAPTQWRSIESLGIPGVFSERTVRREYPQGTSTAPLVGWVNSDGKPGGGIEQLFNSALDGKPGLHVYERARDGSPIASGEGTDEPAVPGQSVKLTIDNDLQWYAQNILAQRVQETDGLSGDVVVLDVKTGKVRAAASYPSFDPSNMRSADGYLQLRPFTEVYEPGSTSKVITMAAALEQGVVTPTTPVTVPPTLERAGRPFRDSSPHGTLNLTTAGVLAQSSNIGTVLIGEKFSPEVFRQYASKFGLGQTTGVGFPGESRGIMAPASQWKGDQRYTVLFGQGLAGTAIQQASVFQTIANGGVRQPVQLLEGIDDGDGGWEKPADDRTPQRVIQTDTASQLTRMMQSVVGEGGTATQAAVPGYQVAGKTSTAQRYDSELGRYDGTTASFIGYAPANDPRYVVAVTVQRPRKGTYGGAVAGPVFSKVMSFALQQARIPPTTGGPGPYPMTAPTAPSSSPSSSPSPSSSASREKQ